MRRWICIENLPSFADIFIRLTLLFLLADARLNRKKSDVNKHQHGRSGRENEDKTKYTEPTLTDEDTEGEYIIIFDSSDGTINDNSVGPKAHKLVKSNDLLLEDTFNTSQIYGFIAKNVTAADEKTLREDKHVLLVEKDVILSIDAHFAIDDDLNEPDLETFSTMGQMSSIGCGKMILPWGVKRVGGYTDMSHSWRRVFVVDSGVAAGLEALNLDTKLARNFVPNIPSSQWEDRNGHGTHIAGTIAAKKSCSTVGVAAGARVVPIRVMDQFGKGKLSTVITALSYIETVAKPGDVVNLSIGGAIPQTSLDMTVMSMAQAGVKFAIAAGNSNRHAGLLSPARVNHQNVYTVSAVDRYDCKPSWSNYGFPPIDYAAPGVNILSLDRFGSTALKSGTSMASPHVAGLLLIGEVQTAQNECNEGNAIAHRVT